MTDVAHVFDFDFDSAIGRPGRFGRNGTSETSEVGPSFRALKGFRRQWEKKLVVFMADNASRVCYSDKSRKVVQLVRAETSLLFVVMMPERHSRVNSTSS